MAEQFFEPLTSPLRQGDIFESIPFSFLSTDAAEPSAKLTAHSYKAMLLNQSCDLDKKYPKLVMVPVLPLSFRNHNDQNLIRKNKIFAALHLPAYRDLLPESYISFLEPMAVERSMIESLQRIISLSDEGRRALYVQYTRWISRWQLTELTCPGCGASFNPASTLPVENS